MPDDFLFLRFCLDVPKNTNRPMGISAGAVEALLKICSPCGVRTVHVCAGPCDRVGAIGLWTGPVGALLRLSLASQHRFAHLQGHEELL